MKRNTPRIDHIALLNRIGEELAMSTGVRSGYPVVARQLRNLLELAAVSIWVVDRTHRVLVKEAMDVAPSLRPDAAVLEADEKLTHWQLEHGDILVYRAAENRPCAVSLPAAFGLSFVSLPFEHKGQRRGVLNLYSEGANEWFFQRRNQARNAQFLRSLAGQMAIFAENRALEGFTTLYRELHHRVKNNLQTVAGLLRMQLRRLDRMSAEQALEESINRIMSIALVHETLAQGEVGMVDFGPLVSRIVELLTQDSTATARGIVEISGAPVVLPSKEATSLALVVNELVQNALQHGCIAAGGERVQVRIRSFDDTLEVSVSDAGPGLAPGFDLARDANLGLEIVSMLVHDELKGRFELSGSKGTTARVVLPLSQVAQPL